MTEISEASPLVCTGGCHCGAVRFRVSVRRRRVSDCNCSICTKKGFLHVIVPAADFELLSGAERMTTYRFNTGVAKHTFCSVCGIHSFGYPRSHPDGVTVNLRCLDGDWRESFEIVPFDGQNWEQTMAARGAKSL